MIPSAARNLEPSLEGCPLWDGDRFDKSFMAKLRNDW
jgi:hypothetical protein